MQTNQSVFGSGSVAAMVAALVFVLGFAPAALAVTDAQVGETIDLLVEYLYSKQNDAGHWDPNAPGGGSHTYGLQYGGKSTLATYALIASGQSYQNPKLAKAIAALRKFEVRGTYACALRIHVWNQLPDSFQSEMAKDLKFLLTCPKESPAGSKARAFSYGPGVGGWSNSRTQYGMLGLWEAAKRGHAVPRGLWEGLEEHFNHTQLEDGGWYYAPNHYSDSTVAMTAAGLTAMYIFRDFRYTGDFREPGKLARHPLQKRIDDGLQFFDKHWKPNTDTPGRGTQAIGYHLYGTERVGLASGRKYFGGKDWFREGAEFIIKNTKKGKGFGIGRNTGVAGNIDSVVRSSFALLFLTRGRVPVFINKLEIPDYHWNNRPADTAHLTRWVSGTVEQEMNWQVLPITTDPEVWLEAPMLYFAGHEAFELNPAEEAKIKRYIDLGGMLVTSADRASPQFTKSVQAMMKRLYPGYSYDRIDPNDELNNIVFKLTSNRIGAQTIHNGVRHLAIHLPRGDVSWTFQSETHSDPMPWQLMVNAYYYATEKGHVRPRLAEHYIPKLRGKGDKAPPVTVTRARYAGNWDPEPGAWAVQSNAMHNADRAKVTIKATELASIADEPRKFVHVVGTDEVAFADSEIEAIRKHVESGGVILFENAGGRGPFAQSVMGMLRQAYPRQRLRPISLESPVVNGKGIGGTDATEVQYRIFALLRMGEINTPRLLSLNFDGEPRIILSGEDLSAGMVGQPIWDVFGYSTDSARALVGNIALWASRPQ